MTNASGRRGWRRWRDRLWAHDTLNYWLSRHVPRAALTHLMGWYSRIDNPVLTRLALALWRRCADLDLSEAAPAEYRSLRDVFTRALRPGARPFDPDPTVLCSPCDAIVGACGDVHGTTVWQAKGMPYRLEELMGADAAARHANGRYVTLRLTPTMYHRFHAPADWHVHRVRYVSGDVFNVNPPALRRIPRLFCRNERALIEGTLTDGSPIALVPVAAILVASIRLHFLDVTLHLRWRGAHELPCDAHLPRGQELGWFEHGSTILFFVPAHWRLADGIEPGHTIRAGQALWRRAAA
ncbi:archaetidylserine decarboxylase [Tepidimonas thermarum]|uniref:archaetidylserine decarboxylase n=1 Tax=Tepidimonas thermarum TaxID=335431 RepID=UPI001FE50A8C|nr:archaetidylserine decarboxylase [Tepidimonas thermarum]